MSSSERSGKPLHLRCHLAGHLQIRQGHVDDLLAEALILALSDETLTRRPPGEDAKLDQVRADLAAVKLQLAELAAAVANRSISVMLAASAEPPLLQEAARLAALERELSLPPVLSRFAAPATADARERWGQMPMSARRDLARALCVPGRLGIPTIGRNVDRSWCQAKSHGRPVQSCEHTTERRLSWEGAAV